MFKLKNELTRECTIQKNVQKTDHTLWKEQQLHGTDISEGKIENKSYIDREYRVKNL